MICKTCKEEKKHEQFAKNIHGERLNTCLDCLLKRGRSFQNCIFCNKSITEEYRTRKICKSCRATIGDREGRENIRSRVRHRDNYTCQHCFKKWKRGNRKFDVHHLEEEGASRRYDYEKDMEKLITLCHKCHMQLHYKYGMGHKVGQIPTNLFK